MSQTKSIMCFGDSLTWGYVPILEGSPTTRYPVEQRWPGVMAAQLGVGYHIIEEGMNGRNTTADDPLDDRLNGSKHLPTAIASHLPLDLVILMLGTNDTKSIFQRTAYDIAFGMAKLVIHVLTGAGGIGTVYPAPKCLVVAPPPLAVMPHPFFAGLYEGGHEKSKELGAQYKAMADFMKVDFLNAGDYISTDGCDGLHFTAQNNIDLGNAIAPKVKEIFARG